MTRVERFVSLLPGSEPHVPKALAQTARHTPAQVTWTGRDPLYHHGIRALK